MALVFSIMVSNQDPQQPGTEDPSGRTPSWDSSHSPLFTAPFLTARHRGFSTLCSPFSDSPHSPSSHQLLCAPGGAQNLTSLPGRFSTSSSAVPSLLTKQVLPLDFPFSLPPPPTFLGTHPLLNLFFLEPKVHYSNSNSAPLFSERADSAPSLLIPCPGSQEAAPSLFF